MYPNLKTYNMLIVLICQKYFDKLKLSKKISLKNDTRLGISVILFFTTLLIVNAILSIRS